MKTVLNCMIAMMIGAFLSATVPASAAAPSTGEGAPKSMEGDAGKAGTPKQRQVHKKRRSSGKQIIEETTIEERAKPDSGRSQGSKAKSSGTSSELTSPGEAATRR